jgi:hypothetical protein
MGEPHEKFDFVSRWDRLEKLHHLVAVVSREKQPPRRPDTLLAGSTESSDHGLARPLRRLVSDENLWEWVILAAHARCAHSPAEAETMRVPIASHRR